ncbi:MAG: acyltransferase family protein [Dermatophilaceae bacterium]|nr:acyltransferase [Intrasporangiaceae bacterium]
MTATRVGQEIRGPSSRLPALDVLRGVAILCMLIAHGVPFLWPTGVSRPLELVLGAINAVASPLFGLAMGAAGALVWARPTMAGQWPRRVLSDIGRGVVVFATGMLLVELNTWVAIVLHVLGVLIVLGIPVAALAGASMRHAPAGGRLRSILGGLTLVTFALAPWVTGAVAPVGNRLANGTTGGVAELWAALVAGESYRALSLLPFFALGALIAAVGLLERPRRLSVVSFLVAVVLVPGYAFVRRSWVIGLSGDPVDQLFDLTLVMVALAVVTLLVDTLSRRRALWQPLADLGAIALSVYALQLVVLRPLMDWQGWTTSRALAWVSLLVLVLVPSAVMIWWRRALGPGPLEHVVALVTGKGRAT